MPKNYEIFIGKDLEVADKILRRRMQMLVHSYLYYKLNTNMISDRDFDAWGKELVLLQAQYPDIAEQVDYAEDFRDWDASTGFHLPVNEQVVRIAYRLTRKSIANVKKPNTKPAPTKPKQKTSARKSLF